MGSTADPTRWSVRRAARAVALLDLVVLVILAVHLAGGAASAATDEALRRRVPDPMAVIGQTFDQTGCIQAPLAVGEAILVVCRDFSAITDQGGKALVVSLYGPDSPAVRAYGDRLPQGLHWGESIKDVVATLGEPKRITDMFGTPTLVYMYRHEAYGSLELRFNGADRLSSINACLTH